MPRAAPPQAFRTVPFFNSDFPRYRSLRSHRAFRSTLGPISESPRRAGGRGSPRSAGGRELTGGGGGARLRGGQGTRRAWLEGRTPPIGADRAADGPPEKPTEACGPAMRRMEAGRGGRQRAGRPDGTANRVTTQGPDRASRLPGAHPGGGCVPSWRAWARPETPPAATRPASRPNPDAAAGAQEWT